MKEHCCKYCRKGFDRGVQLGGHVVFCSLNPKSVTTKEKIRIHALRNNAMDNLSNREKISKTIKSKILKGEWHNSFSKSRTHEYNGIKLYGMWEVNYAKWLDSNNILWRKPDESFPYIFEGVERRYTPDFYLIKEEIYIEIKGYPTPKDVAKWTYFPLKLRVLFGENLYNLGIIDNFRKTKEEYIKYGAV